MRDRERDGQIGDGARGEEEGDGAGGEEEGEGLCARGHWLAGLSSCRFFCVYAYKVFGENPSSPLISFLTDISMGFSISMLLLNYHINLAAIGTCDLG